MEEIYLLSGGFIVLVFIFLFCFIIAIKLRERKIKKQIQSLAASSLEISTVQFFNLRKTHIASIYNFSGVYILYNKTKNMYYVGQGKKVFDRINAHFSGRGNGDVYADYKYGDTFTIKMIALENSRFSTLNELERNTIMTYGAFLRGYNKTRGNRG